ncbi:MAG: alpha/beta hydrolase [Paracoccus sp. (in: a-proteobacteria)]|nr:alpha/beta hydrolase [Paracoccus sp. (in: a-proteobacteria)]
MNIGSDNFYTSDQVSRAVVRFPSQLGLEIAGNLIRPKDATGPLPALIVGHPMGAVKEQAATLYATKMAERGYVTLAIDLPYWGESEGQPRNTVAPDAYAEAFSAAVDYLTTQDVVDAARIGVIGVCASGGFALSAAKIDPRLRAIATTSMLDMGAATRMLVAGGTDEGWQAAIEASAAQRDAQAAGGAVAYTGGTVLEITDDTPQLQRDFYDFYRTPRGKVVPEGATDDSITRPTLASNARFLNFYPMNDLHHISPRPILLIAGDRAESLSFSQAAYEAAAEPKELFLIEDAGHVDLYDGVNVIPWDKLQAFFDEALGA